MDLIQAVQCHRIDFDREHQDLSPQQRETRWKVYWDIFTRQALCSTAQVDCSRLQQQHQSHTEPDTYTASTPPASTGESSATLPRVFPNNSILQPESLVLAKQAASEPASVQCVSITGLEDAISFQAENFDFGNDPEMPWSQFPGYSPLPSPPNFENVRNEFQDHQFDQLPTQSATINNTEASPQWHLYWNETPDYDFLDPLHPAVTQVNPLDEAIGAQNYLIPGPIPCESNDTPQLQAHQDDVGRLEGKLQAVQTLQTGQKQRRFHHQQILVLRKWLRSHLPHPFPSADDKEQLSSASGLSVRQIERWFARTRARHLAENRGLTAADLADKVSAQIGSKRCRPSDLDNIAASRPCSAHESSLMVAVASPPEGPTSLTSLLSFVSASPVEENDLAHLLNDLREEPEGDGEGSPVTGWLTSLPEEFETVPESCIDLSNEDKGSRAPCEHATNHELVLDLKSNPEGPGGHYDLSGQNIRPLCGVGALPYSAGAATPGITTGHTPNHSSENTHDARGARITALGSTLDHSQSSIAAVTRLDMSSVLESSIIIIIIIILLLLVVPP